MYDSVKKTKVQLLVRNRVDYVGCDSHNFKEVRI
jgi:hypothetical protein